MLAGMAVPDTSARIRGAIAAACGSVIGALAVLALFANLFDRVPDETWAKILVGGAFWLAASLVAGLGAWLATRPFYTHAAKTGFSVFVIGGLLPYPAYLVWVVVRPDPALLYITMAITAGVVAQLLVSRLDWSRSSRSVPVRDVA
jgi:hypothetical protein